MIQRDARRTAALRLWYKSGKRFRIARALVLTLITAVSGCAVYDTYKNCGFQGCPGDAKITADVRSQFQQSSFLEPNAIRVQTLNHVVYLGGVVVSGLEIDAAESIARNVPDVADVVNSIVVAASR
jgi:osmotically-inducible protein OsmY